MNISYKIKFYSDWHCGSGLSSGVDLDMLVIKDKDGLPFVPGKTIKGLLLEAVEEINAISEQKFDDDIKKVFGVFDKKEKGMQGCCFFTNVSIEKELGMAIRKGQLQEHLFRTIASTAINENGVSKDNSLRKTEVSIPCELIGEILDVPDSYFVKKETGKIEGVGFGKRLEEGLKFIKRLGQNRNRGLGRCSFEIINEEGGIK